MKKYSITFLLSFSIFLTLNAASCYQQWNDAFESATAEYDRDVARCSTAVSRSLCMRNADASYGHALWSAGNDYINCSVAQE